MSYKSTKTWGHEVGLSCAFRQWRASSHCHFVHGYAISVKLTFGAEDLDYRNWVVDFGGLKNVKDFLVQTFDHKLVIAADDPAIAQFIALSEAGAADIVIVNAVGCEKFAQIVGEYVVSWLRDNSLAPRVWLLEAEVREHGGNSAIWVND